MKALPRSIASSSVAAAGTSPALAPRWLGLFSLLALVVAILSGDTGPWFEPANAPTASGASFEPAAALRPLPASEVTDAPHALTVDPGVEALAAERLSPPAPAPHAAFEGARVISFYGYPGIPVMGRLGAYEPEEAARAAAEFARSHDAPGQPRVVPALHLIVAVAQATPQPDGAYLGRIDPALVERYVRATREQGLLLFLDVQVGWSDALTEVRQLERFLREPHVQLALDPEFATRGAGRAPGQVIGTLTAEDVNSVQQYAAALVQRERLPRKLLVIHQFTDQMLSDPERYEAYPEVEIAIDMDGFGGAAAKLSKYDRYSLGAYSERPAIKLFFDWDVPLLTPGELAGLSTPPGLVIYQ